MVPCLNSSLCSFIHNTARLLRPPRQEVTQAHTGSLPAVFRRPLAVSQVTAQVDATSPTEERVCVYCVMIVMIINV